jgi:hypothetical protein
LHRSIVVISRCNYPLQSTHIRIMAKSLNNIIRACAGFVVVGFAGSATFATLGGFSGAAFATLVGFNFSTGSGSSSVSALGLSLKSKKKKTGKNDKNHDKNHYEEAKNTQLANGITLKAPIIGVNPDWLLGNTTDKPVGNPAPSQHHAWQQPRTAQVLQFIVQLHSLVQLRSRLLYFRRVLFRRNLSHNSPVRTYLRVSRKSQMSSAFSRIPKIHFIIFLLRRKSFSLISK